MLLGLGEREGSRQGGKGPGFHLPTHPLKNLSKQLSGITLAKLIIIITRTQSRKNCFVTINIHFLHSGLLSKQQLSQSPEEPEARRWGWGGVGKSEWPVAGLQGSAFSPSAG